MDFQKLKNEATKTRTAKFLAIGTLVFTGLATTIVENGNYFEIAKNIEIFANLYKEVNTYYVDEIDPSTLMKTGIDAMMESLDPYTDYISETQIEGYRFITEGKYNGIGADIRIIDGLPTVVAPYLDAPAQKAGLKAGDKIVAIDGKDTKGKTSDEVSAILKGYPGTEVELTISRLGEAKNLNITLVRDEVEVSNIPYSGMVSSDVGYIALTTFTRDAGANVGKALRDLKTEQPNLKGVILDLRDNGGGLLAEAVNLCNIFIPKDELVVTTKGKVKDWDRSFRTQNPASDPQVPLIVLINKGSASASEIVSGTIQDLDRGVLLGQRSYGKGLVQNTRDIGYNAKVKMTTAKYYIPSGRCIQAVEYQNGEPVDIAESKRAPFKTRNGRPVLDGGGVKPDIVLDSDAGSNILQTLDEKYVVFNYVNQWMLKNPEVKSLEDFHFTDWDDFLQFLAKQNFDFDTETEKLLKDLKEKSKTGGYLSQADILALETKVVAAKKADIDKHKERISDMIEKEIVSRAFYEKGRIQMGLRNDLEIKEAIKLFGDKAKYDGILKG
ncbi:MAG: S41 family peptidase [Saprospiraceae bacterium]|nr:S41 family peptidase [Saprospiraceae bacterium]